MGIEMIKKNNGDQLIEYKLPDFINQNVYNLGNNPNDYEVLQVLGGGGFSKVLKVKSKTNFGIYAMKKVDMAHIIEEEELSPKYFENEVLFLKKLNHPNIIKCYNIFQEKQYLYFIMEFMNNGDLKSYNEGIIKMNVRIPEDKLWEIFYKCLSGLDYIHKEKIVHRDIKLENLFLDDKFNVKIGDFNVSAIIDKNAAMKFADNTNQAQNLMNTNTTLGTYGYQAPEIGKRQYNQKVDIYSMGISFYELCFGHKPGKKMEINDGFYSNEIISFIYTMIDNDENKRPTCNQLMSYAKVFFIKTYVKNSSVEAALFCFSNFQNFDQYFSNNDVVNYIYELKKEVSGACVSVIQSMKTNNENQKKRDLYELRKILEKEGLDIKSDNKEIDPGNFINFFISKLNSELNETVSDSNKINDNEQIRRYKILSKNYSFPPGQEESSFNLILNTYNRKILSFISRNFFSFIKIKRQCFNCQNISCYFSKLFFIPININILRQKVGHFGNIHLKNAIETLKSTYNIIDDQKGIKCSKCNQISQFGEVKNFYHIAKNLIFIFDRGENLEHNNFINFDEFMSLNGTDIERYNLINYYLVGIIVKFKDEYISFIKINNIWLSSNGQQFMFENIKNFGIVVALFYYSNDNILILDSFQNNNQPQFNNNFNSGNQIMMNNNPQQINQFNNNQNFNGIQMNKMNQIFKSINTNINNMNMQNLGNNNNNNNFQFNNQNNLNNQNMNINPFNNQNQNINVNNFNFQNNNNINNFNNGFQNIPNNNMNQMNQMNQNNGFNNQNQEKDVIKTELVFNSNNFNNQNNNNNNNQNYQNNQNWNGMNQNNFMNNQNQFGNFGGNQNNQMQNNMMGFNNRRFNGQ